MALPKRKQFDWMRDRVFQMYKPGVMNNKKHLHAITISPPMGSMASYVEIQKLVNDYFGINRVRPLFVYEFSPEGRLHWHGIADMHGYGEQDMVKELKLLLADSSFVDSRPVDSLPAWLNYMTKDVPCNRVRGADPISNGLRLPPGTLKSWKYTDKKTYKKGYRTYPSHEDPMRVILEGLTAQGVDDIVLDDPYPDTFHIPPHASPSGGREGASATEGDTILAEPEGDGSPFGGGGGPENCHRRSLDQFGA